MPEYKAAMMSDTKIRTGKVRVSYEQLMTPKGFEGGTPKYSACVIIPKSDKQCMEVIRKAVDNAVKAGVAKYGKSFNKENIRMPVHDGDTEKNDPACADSWYINISSKQKPGLVDRNMREITDPGEIYSGMWGRFTINFYPYNKGGTGVSAGLHNFQKLEDGERLGGMASAEKDFGEAEEAEDEDDFFA